MLLCYLDESGDAQLLPAPNAAIQPVLVIAGVAFEQSRLVALTRDMISLKQRYFPRLLSPSARPLDWILAEVKGSELRRDVRSGTHRERRHAIGFLDRVVELLVAHDVKIFGRVWIKAIGAPNDGRAIYTYSVQAICEYFQDLLTRQNRAGLILADSRTKALNANVAHSIFTRRYSTQGDPYGRMLEVPTFGHSDNHAGLQLADYICSSLLFPIASFTYCSGHVTNVHVDPNFSILKQRHSPILKQLQHRYRDENGRWRGGITVSDAIGHRGGGLLFS